MTGGLIALAAVLAVATLLGVMLRRRAGQFRPAPSAAQSRQAQTREAPTREAQTREAQTQEALTEADLGGALGERATLVQFSTEFCAPCRPTRQILAQVAGSLDGVRHVEIDAADRLDLVRRLRINSTPTVLVLGPDGVIAQRATGLPRQADVIAALGSVIRPADLDQFGRK